MLAGADHRLVVGADARLVEGETNEAFFWNGTEFTRLRRAGGRQLFAGLFAEDTWSVSERASIVGALRVDHWELGDGFRRESDRGTGRVRASSEFADRDGEELNGRLGTRVQLSDSIAIRAAAYSGFRVPTLNELYRPFRVGNDVTEANAQLAPEQLLGGEAGVEWQPTQTFRIAVTPFINRITGCRSGISRSASVPALSSRAASSPRAASCDNGRTSTSSSRRESKGERRGRSFRRLP
jgi:outer membrane receptor protein involved in Fe transport